MKRIVYLLFSHIIQKAIIWSLTQSWFSILFGYRWRKTIIERKIDELLDKYDGDIYVYEAFHEYAELLNSFLFHNREYYDRVHVISEIDRMGDLTKLFLLNVGIEVLEKNLTKEISQGFVNQNTCRYFNQIKIEDDKVIKIAKTEDAIKLQKIEMISMTDIAIYHVCVENKDMMKTNMN